MKELTAERLREVLEYFPETGKFVWRVQLGSRGVVGSVAGKWHQYYFYIGIDNHRYAAHQLAWLYMTGRWPHPLVDHEDHDGHNNTWTNLREATHTQNQFNRRKQQGCTSQYKGVTLHRKSGRWIAKIKINGRTKALGYFDAETDAGAAYREAALTTRGEFAYF